MIDEGQPGDVDHPTDSGIFGKLPRSRPGARSPRRGVAEAPRKGISTQAAPIRRPRPAAPPPPQPPPPPAPSRAPEHEPAETDLGGLDDLAWAGITVAAEAATSGVRLFTRALEAMRGSAERR